MSDYLYDLLDEIIRLRDTAFLQPPHWEREPSQSMLDEEEAARLRSVQDYEKLKSKVRELSHHLLSPFEEYKNETTN